jgi:UDP-3-O-[3-hydroxymyristoyl] glucosamine N-acyltransferase
VIAGASATHSIGGEGGSVLTAASIATMVGGTLVGSGDVEIDAIAPLDRAGPRELSFLASERYAAQFAETRAGAVLISPELSSSEGPTRTRIVVPKPHEALIGLLSVFYRQSAAMPGIDSSATIGRGTRIGSAVSIGARVVIGDECVIGDGAVIGPHCVVGERATIGERSRLNAGVIIYSGARIGNRVILHSGAVIGGDGFGYVYRDNQHQRIPHVGGCLIEDDVEIGSNTTIDRGSVSDTVIGAGTKIDNLVHVGHNVRIGRLCLIMAQAGIAGSATVEDGAIIAGQVGIGGHTTIGRGARLAGQAGVFGDVPAGETWSGYPARPHKESLRTQAALHKLAKLIRPIERLILEMDSKSAKR